MRTRRAHFQIFLLILALGAPLLLSSCGHRVSPEAYEQQVVQLLAGQTEERLPPLLASLNRLLRATACAETEVGCQDPAQLGQAAELADDERFVISEYIGRICERRKFRPPRELRADQRRICELLEQLRLDVDALKLTANYAAQLLSHYSTPGSANDEGLPNFSRKLAQERETLLSHLQDLRAIDWLAPLFAATEG